MVCSGKVVLDVSLGLNAWGMGIVIIEKSSGVGGFRVVSIMTAMRNVFSVREGLTFLSLLE